MAIVPVSEKMFTKALSALSPYHFHLVTGRLSARDEEMGLSVCGLLMTMFEIGESHDDLENLWQALG